MYPHHFESRAQVDASPAKLFTYLDDQERLSSHMMKSSAMMAGMRMQFEFDERRGRPVGLRMRLSGKVLGLSLEVIEVVAERDPPRRKVWETRGEPRLLVIGPYRMGFEIVPDGDGSQLLVFVTMTSRRGHGAQRGSFSAASMRAGAREAWRKAQRRNSPATETPGGAGRLNAAD